MEIDIYIPSLKLGIEYNGLFWHSEADNKMYDYHVNKLDNALKNGVNLLQIFSDEWQFKQDVVKDKIKRLLKADSDFKKIDCGRCEFRELYNNEALKFVTENSLVDFKDGCVYIGAIEHKEIVACIGFQQTDDESWEIIDVITKMGYKGKKVFKILFNNFCESYEPNYVEALLDRRFAVKKGINVFDNVGLKFDSIVMPKPFYCDRDVRIDECSESTVTVWDCGYYKFKKEINYGE